MCKLSGRKESFTKRKIAAYAWRDKKTIFFLSSADDPTLDNLELRKKQKDGTQILVASPGVVQNDNIKMNGVDKSDHT